MKKCLVVLPFFLTLCTISPVFAAPQESIENILDVAYAQIGYQEKQSNKQLYEFTANVGYRNYTKYAQDLYDWGFYSSNLNGSPWCDIFVDWCFCAAFGVASAKEITYQTPYGSAACYSSMNYFKQAGQFYKIPEIGDQIFFANHTGLVYNIENSTIYTIEGNTSKGVKLKSYSLNSKLILGYGRPDYQKLEDVEIKPNNDFLLTPSNFVLDYLLQKVKEN